MLHYSSDFRMSEAIREAYKRGEDDESMEPLVRVNDRGNPIGRIQNGDYVIFYDIRGEREIELTEAFTDSSFNHFSVDHKLTTHWVTMIEYDKGLDVKVAFPPIEEIDNTLSEVISRSGLRQVKISESEKAIHVSYFFNGRRKKPFPGEDRIAVPSRKDVGNFDKCPEMNAADVADSIIDTLRQGKYNFIVGNFANIDVLGHIENREAILKAVRVVDEQVGRVIDAARRYGATTIITSDHGTVEKWLYPEGAIDTGHTDSPVHFFMLSSDDDRRVELRPRGTLCDVAPTILSLLGLQKPEVMSGRSLIQNGQDPSLGRVLLLITDGWGHSEDAYGNLIHAAETPVMDQLKRGYQVALLEAAGEAVGLPAGTVGNSEAGHLHLGAGRIIHSDRVRIERAIADRSFFENEAFLWAMEGAKRDGKGLHLLGIISFFSSHGSVEHLLHLLHMAKDQDVSEVYVHGLLGRRGERPESGARYTRKVEEKAADLGLGCVASIIGRFWALDREENWDRIEKTCRMLVNGRGRPVS